MSKIPLEVFKDLDHCASAGPGPNGTDYFLYRFPTMDAASAFIEGVQFADDETLKIEGVEYRPEDGFYYVTVLDSDVEL